MDLIKEYGPYGPQGPWAHKTKLFKKPFSLGLQVSKRHVGILDLKNLFVSPDQFPNDMLGFW